MATAAQKTAAAREIARRMFDGGKTATATLNLDDLSAAVESLDAAMATVISSVPGAWQAKTIKAALVDNLPEPFQSTATPSQKALALALWAFAEADVL